MKTRIVFILSITAILTLAADSAFGSSYSGGSGTAGNPYQIASNADLLALAANTGDYSKCFILTADIDMEGQIFTEAIIAADTVAGSYFDGTAFNGTFDGNGHKITNFTINGGTNYYIGLFGYLDQGGSVKNLGIKDCNVSGSVSVGGLVGWNEGTLTSCCATASVSGTEYLVGGLVGSNGVGSIISNCYSTGPVSGSSGSQYVGGLVWQNDGSIINCYSTGLVSGSYSYYVGGLVGQNDGSISDCYSAGSVGSSFTVGGLVGYNYDGSISNCYSTGPVSGSSRVGGLVGYYAGGSIVGCFWDTNTSGQSTSAGGTGKTTPQMKTLFTFTSAGWDFTNETTNGTSDYWRMCVDGVDYPRLSWQSLDGDLACPDGVNFVDFAYFAERWQTTGCNSSNNFCGGADMDFSGEVDIDDLEIFTANWLSGYWVCPDNVNFVDFAYFAERWQTTGCNSSNNFCGGADLNFSGTVDMQDLAIFVANWLGGE